MAKGDEVHAVAYYTAEVAQRLYLNLNKVLVEMVLFEQT